MALSLSVRESFRVNLIIAGYMPHLSQFAFRAAHCATGWILVAFQMHGVVYLERDDRGGWRLRWILAPELLSRPVAQQSVA